MAKLGSNPLLDGIVGSAVHPSLQMASFGFGGGGFGSPAPAAGGFGNNQAQPNTFQQQVAISTRDPPLAPCELN